MAISEGSTIIGESILINGNLNGDEDLTVRGRVEGTLTLTKTLVVEQTGVVRAEVQVKNCIISGAVVGNVTATESVEITKAGRMVGDISFTTPPPMVQLPAPRSAAASTWARSTWSRVIGQRWRARLRGLRCVRRRVRSPRARSARSMEIAPRPSRRKIWSRRPPP